MLKRLVLLFSLGVASNQLVSMELFVTLPSAQELQKVLCNNQERQFVEKSKIDEVLGNRTVAIQWIVPYVEQLCVAYLVVHQAQVSKPNVIGSLLHHVPEVCTQVLVQLKNGNFPGYNA